MSALDQAFIKAYAKDGPAPSRSDAAPPASTPARFVAGSPGAPASTRAEAMVPAPLIENAYADGALYRIEAPAQADHQTAVSPPHYAPPPSQHRTTQRRSIARHRQVTEPALETASPPAEAAAAVRRMPVRALSEVARRLAHYVPPAPSADLSPEVVVVDDSVAPPLVLPIVAPLEPSPKVAVPVAVPPENNVTTPVAKPVVATAQAAPRASTPPPSDDVATLVEVCTPWEMINDAVSASMVILADAPDLPANPLVPPVDVALDPIVARHETTIGESTSSGSETADLEMTPPKVAGENPAAVPPDQSKKSYRIDPPRSQAPDAPHFAPTGVAAASEPRHIAQPAVELPAAARVELSPEEMASLIGTPPTEKHPDEPLPTTEPAVTVATPLVPMWEVDRFQWPNICDRLMKDERSYFAQAGGKLVAAAKDGLNTLGITGSRRGEGRTTLALCLARCAAQSGLNVAMIDADFTRPQLAAVIGLEVAYGWQDAAQGKIPLAEAAVKSLADKITVLPLEPSSVAWPLALADKRVSAIIRAVAQTHDLVIIDLGPLPGGSDPIFASDEPAPLDAAIVLRDLRYASPAETQAIGERLHASGVEAIGIAENFVPAQQASVA